MPKTLRTHRDEDGSDDEQEKFDRALVQKHVTQLQEHFTSVRITVTRHCPQEDQSRAFSTGAGDFYSQYAATREWLMQQDEATRQQVRDDD